MSTQDFQHKTLERLKVRVRVANPHLWTVGITPEAMKRLEDATTFERFDERCYRQALRARRLTQEMIDSDDERRPTLWPNAYRIQS